jgi:hypothetical protein
MGLRAGLREVAVDDPAVLHVGREQAEGRLCGRRPGDPLAVGPLALARRDEHVALLVERPRAHPCERLVVEVGEAGVELGFLEPALDLA